jgi:uncharacterized membrane protein
MGAMTHADQRRANQTPAYGLAAMLIGTGTGHFLVPKPFDTIVPAELPGSPRTYTYVSGIAEVATGALLLAPVTRRFGALAPALLFAAVFPANFNMVRLWWPKGWPMRIVALARLPLQITMIVRGAQSQAQRLAPSARSAANSSGPASLSGTTVAPVRT